MKDDARRKQPSGRQPAGGRTADYHRKIYQSLFENSGNAMAIVEEDHTVSLANTEMERLCGYTRAEVEGKKMWMDFIAAEDLPRMQEYQRLRRIDPDAAPRNYECRMVNKHGGLRDVYLTITVLPEINKRLVSMLDITERKQAEKALRASEARFRTYIETSPNAIISFGTDDQVVMANGQAAKMLGFESKDEIIGLRVLDFIAPQDRVRAASYKGFILDGGVLRNIEYTLLRRDGSQFPADMSIAALQDEAGRSKEFIAVVSDITDRKLAEEQLRHLSFHDPLTGLYNRAYFEEEMRRYEGGRFFPAGIIVCDVDGLKLVNDTLGHDAGDAVLLAAAGVIAASFRTNDVVARIGGDEFAVLLPNSDGNVVENSRRRIRDNVARYNAANPGIPLSISTGFAVGLGASERMADLFKEADNNMYREKLHSGRSARSAIVQTLMKSLEARDFITEGHADRMQDLVVDLARSMGFPEHKIADLRLLARFHDFGKVGIPDRILFKKGPLTPQEAREMQRHCEIGYRITMSAPDLAPIADWILKHHEWWNGEGYPLGLKGEDIPLECRILAIADAYDALTSNRPYRQAVSHEEAIAELRKFAGRQFDPRLVDRFIQMFADK